MSQDFHCRPCEFYGLHLSAENSWLALSVDRSVWTFGSFIKARQQEMIEVDAPPRKSKERPKIHKPKYTDEQIQWFVFGPLPDEAAIEMARSGQTSMPYLNVSIDDVEAEPDMPHRFQYMPMPNIPKEATM